ncbi:small GTP-binding protein [Thalassoporum mexicanum PCC 7367]|uniref:Rab family GTPase n=1 Tax=Thalassoporum mexicanum TaxID=3457544 RepID=UPI00029F8E75|nr:Rab family GTPase [Pseudanabaena sp. PCC 7367]AFY68829.1 small GTP-binding protein [Pseudanabaena sp. PCC 7367]
MTTVSKKICMIGDFAVGKTSLIRRFVDQAFSDRYLSTVGVKISRKLVDLAESSKYKSAQLLIWDLEGQTKFKSIAPSYLQGASGAIIVADATRPETIASIAGHVELFLSINPKASVSIAFNKIDLVDPPKLAHLQEMLQLPNQLRRHNTYDTSAKTGKDVDLIFQKLAHEIVESA